MKRAAVLAAILATGVLATAPTASSDRSAAAYSFVQIASGLDSPVYVATAPGDSSTLYVVEQPGAIVTVRNGQVTGTFLDMRDRVKSGGEQGLLSMAFDPAYARNHLFYVDYTDLNGDTHVTQLTAGDPSSGRDLLFVKQPYPNHNGGQLEFDRAGYLYVGMGDGGTGPVDPSPGDPQNHAQDLSSRLGKLLRIRPQKTGAIWQIVGFGLRNPWRFSFDRTTGDLWIGDVGAGYWEEIDYRARTTIGALANYGWPRFEGDEIYPTYGPGKKLLHKGALVKPVWVYSHQFGCAVTGGYVYRGGEVPAARGRYFFGDFCSGTIWSFKVGRAGRASTITPLFDNSIPNLDSFGEDGRGELYAVSLDGGLYELR
jgi:glucose/arabinose dehydrogenase